MVVVQRANCVGAYNVGPETFFHGATHSLKITLEEMGGMLVGDEKGGAAKIAAIAEGKLNELTPGKYKICYATKETGGEDEADFKMLASELEILPPTALRPIMTVPRTVQL